MTRAYAVLEAPATLGLEGDGVNRCVECGFDAHVAKQAPPEYIERMLHGSQ